MPQPLTALVLGSNGQDGSLITRRLVGSGKFRVVGVGRQPQPRWSYDSSSFRYVSVDLAGEPAVLNEILHSERPDRVFHLAAVHGSATTRSYEPVFAEMLSVNVASVHGVLEYARTHNPSTRLVYASSAKVFGSPLPRLVDESTARRSTCLYSVTKNAAADLIDYYRKEHGIAAAQAFLFNHESELRPREFFMPKLARCINDALAGAVAKTDFSNLHFYCDWGSADEYMGILLAIAERFPRDDFVVATGKTEYALDLVERAFRGRGLRWQDHVTELSAAEGAYYEADVQKLRAAGLAPSVTADTLIENLIADQRR